MLLVLWSHPRCLSTVFERVMIERGDLNVLHEPFSYLYYGPNGRRELGDMQRQPGHPDDYRGIRQLCLQSAADRSTFVKDMAYHCLEELLQDEELLRAAVHTFLVRHPERSIPSLAARDPEATCEEVGLEAQWRLFEVLTQTLNRPPVVVDADDLLADSARTIRLYCESVGLQYRPDSMQWRRGAPQEWKVWEAWHRDAAESTEIQPVRRSYERTVGNDDRLREWYDHHLPYYRRLRQHRLVQQETSTVNP